MKSTESHHFFLHAPELASTSLTVGMHVTLPPAIAHRIATILRLKEDELVTLFAGAHCITVKLNMILGGKKSHVTGMITAIETKMALAPEITLICGVVKTATFEEICFTATQLGVSKIIPVLTDKSYTKPYTDKEISKFLAHCVAAAEQSKQIILPTLEKPLKLSSFLEQGTSATDTKIIFEATGSPLKTILSKMLPTKLTVAFGPEGGFTLEEQLALTSQGFEKLRLCSPILRTQDAIEVGIGALRSLL